MAHPDVHDSDGPRGTARKQEPSLKGKFSSEEAHRAFGAADVSRKERKKNIPSKDPSFQKHTNFPLGQKMAAGLIQWGRGYSVL